MRFIDAREELHDSRLACVGDSLEIDGVVFAVLFSEDFVPFFDGITRDVVSIQDGSDCFDFLQRLIVLGGGVRVSGNLDESGLVARSRSHSFGISNCTFIDLLNCSTGVDLVE